MSVDILKLKCICWANLSTWNSELWMYTWISLAWHGSACWSLAWPSLAHLNGLIFYALAGQLVHRSDISASQCSSAVTIIDIDIDIAMHFRYRSISISRYMLVFQPWFSLQWFDALHRRADCARFDHNPRTHADANFRIRASLMLCSSLPSATPHQTDAISLLSTPCAAPTPLRLIVSY